jgi:hypothetical protein
VSLAAAEALESQIGAPLFGARTKLERLRLLTRLGDQAGASRQGADVLAAAGAFGLTALADEARGVLRGLVVQFGRKRTPNTVQSGHPIRFDPDTEYGPIRTDGRLKADTPK